MTPLDFARQDIGYTETPVNKTKYGEWYGWNGVAWCVQCVQYWFAMAGHELPFKTASSSALANYYKNNEPDKVVKDPKPNDIVYFNIGSGHTAIIEKDNGNGTVTTREGNTSPGNGGSQDNGGGVYRRIRSKSLIKTLMRPLGDDYMTRDEILAELGDKYIERFSDLPEWAKADMRELLDSGIINGGTDKVIDSEDINMFLSDIKTVIINKRMMAK